MEIKNYMSMKLKAISQNESLARNVVAAFALELNPTIDEISDLKTAVSEAVTNSIVHAYNSSGEGDIVLDAQIIENEIHIEIKDFGVGIKDIEQARLPFYTTKEDEERSGMGFTVMESYMNSLVVENNEKGGTIVKMVKSFETKQDDK